MPQQNDQAQRNMRCGAVDTAVEPATEWRKIQFQGDGVRLSLSGHEEPSQADSSRAEEKHDAAENGLACESPNTELARVKHSLAEAQKLVKDHEELIEGYASKITVLEEIAELHAKEFGTLQ